MQKYLTYCKLFITLSLVVAIAIFISMFVYDKMEMHIWLNGTHTAVGDFFFRNYTIVGEWIPYVIVAFLLFYKAGWSIFLLADVALSGLIGQGLKYWADTDRPYRFFAQNAPDIQLQFVEGVELSKWYSFPSGHTTTFFALFMTLTIICSEAYQHSSKSNKRLSAASFNLQLSTFFFILAIMGGYSRIYLNQHFAEDILGGIIIGLATTTLLLIFVPKLENTRFWNWNLLHNTHLSAFDSD